MKLFKIERNNEVDWDEFDGAVVCAIDEEDARSIHPNGYGDAVPKTKKDETYSSWVIQDDVILTYLGEAKEGLKRGVILSSFNAG